MATTPSFDELLKKDRVVFKISTYRLGRQSAGKPMLDGKRSKHADDMRRGNFLEIGGIHS